MISIELIIWGAFCLLLGLNEGRLGFNKGQQNLRMFPFLMLCFGGFLSATLSTNQIFDQQVQPYLIGYTLLIAAVTSLANVFAHKESLKATAFYSCAALITFAMCVRAFTA